MGKEYKSERIEGEGSFSLRGLGFHRRGVLFHCFELNFIDPD